MRLEGRFVVFLSLLCLLPAPAQAIVYDEAITVPAEETGWRGGLNGGFTSSGGNIEQLDVSAGLTVQYDEVADDVVTSHDDPPERDARLRQQLLLTAKGHYATWQGATWLNQAYSYARWLRTLAAPFGFDFFLQYEFNEFRNLDTRTLAGGAFRIQLAFAKKCSFATDLGYLVEYERLSVEPDEMHERNMVNHRWYGSLAVQIGLLKERVFLKQTAYAEPVVDEPSDIRVLWVSEVLVPLNASLSLKLRFNLHHDSKPPRGVAETDWLTTNALQVVF